MNSSYNDINLISLGSSAFNSSVHRTLQQLGAVVTAIDHNRWIDRQMLHGTGVTVLALESCDYSDKQIIAAIMRHSAMAYLVLIAQPVTQQINNIVALCKEHCIWPCNPRELEFRLDRTKFVSSQQAPVKPGNRLSPESWMEMNLVGHSTSFQKILAIIQNSARCDVPVLIEGETGTGKEMVARAIHFLGTRQDFPFIPVNCGAIPDNLIENELFGHEKGAYTDAKQSYSGLIVQAEGGTLFLDEIEALSAKGQVTLLRFIEDHMIKPLGAKCSKTVNVRIIAASNKPLSDLVEQQKFRQDLLFRLNLISVSLPPLRERTKDIEQLVEFFLQKYRSKYHQPEKCITPEVIQRLLEYAWPGNIRELDNFIHRAFILSADAWISQVEGLETHEDLSHQEIYFNRECRQNYDESFSEAKAKAINVFEARYLTRLIMDANGNVSQAAAAAQKERRALGKLLKKHQIDPAQYRKS